MPKYETDATMSQMETPKIYLLCEEYEDSDIVREFRILAVSCDEDSLKQLMEAKISKDEYGMVHQNGIDEYTDTRFRTEYSDGFVEYYILEEDVLSRDKALELLQSKEFTNTFRYPDGFREILTDVLIRTARGDGYLEINAEKAAEHFMNDPGFRAEIRGMFWFDAEQISQAPSIQSSVRAFCTDQIEEILDESPSLFEDLGFVEPFRVPNNFRSLLISIFEQVADDRGFGQNIDFAKAADALLSDKSVQSQLRKQPWYGPGIPKKALTQMTRESYFCYAHIDSLLSHNPGYFSEVGAMTAKPGLDQIIADAGSRTVQGTSREDLKEKGPEQGRYPQSIYRTGRRQLYDRPP